MTARPSMRAAAPGPRSLIPREHGAYAQLALPLAAVLAAARPSFTSALLCTAAALAFTAHESLIILFGGRGPRARREDGPRALRTLAVLGGLAALLGIAAAARMAHEDRALLLPPFVTAVVALLTAVRLGPRSLWSQLLSSAAFALAVVPVGVASLLPRGTSLLHAGVWMTVFVVSTLMARTIAHRAEPARRRRIAWLSMSILAGGWALVAYAGLPLAAAVALTPACVACVLIALRPPPPAKLRALGWALVATSSFAAIALAAGARL
jgi:hypothetical protein